MSKLPFFLAARFFRADGENKAKASRPAVRVSTISVAVSLAVMIITVGVVRGFRRAFRRLAGSFFLFCIRLSAMPGHLYRSFFT